jgi:hypothetical protein
MADCPDNEKTLSAAYPETATSPIIADIQKVVSAATPMYDIASKLAIASQTYNALNSVVNQLVGYDVRWFRAVPQQRSKDVMFLEFTLYNVEEQPLCVKVVLGSNMPPDSKYDYDLWGLEYEIPFEIQIDKKYWESIAGFGTAPQKKDIVYFTLSNKLFEVESAYLFRGFMEQETTWKINLTKYQPKAARKESAELQATIDEYTTSVEELFGEEVNNEVKKLTDDQQMSAFNATSKDKYKSFDASIATVASALNMYGTMVSQSFYDLQSSSASPAITYNATDLILDHDDRSVLVWIMPRTISSVNKDYNVTSIAPVSFTSSYNASLFYDFDPSLYTKANYSVKLSTPSSLDNISVDDYVNIAREGELNLYAKVVAISQSPLTYHCYINNFVLTDVSTIKSNWNTMNGYVLTTKSPISIIDGKDDYNDSVFSVNIFANQYIAISYGDTYKNDDAYVVRLDEKLIDNTWYGIVVNVGNSWKQYNTYVWEKDESNKNDKLKIKYYQTLRLAPEEIPVSSYRINKSPAYLTNLKLYNVTVEEEKQRDQLLSYFIQDGDAVIIADLGDYRLRIPYISKQR